MSIDLSCGIVGMPNVGKSTFFNILTKNAVQALNFPFCTVDPNEGEALVNDPRLHSLASIGHSQKILPAKVKFVDIAGLVKGAHKGEGLGNQFLGHIREVDVILHMVRCFQDDEVTHVNGNVDPLRDIDIINTELMLCDLASIEKRIAAVEKKIKQNDKSLLLTHELMIRAFEYLKDGKPARCVSISPHEEKVWKTLGLLTAKKIIYVCNVSEDALSDNNNARDSNESHFSSFNTDEGSDDALFSVSFVQQFFNKSGDLYINLCVQLEEALQDLSVDEQKDYLLSLNISFSAVDRLIGLVYSALNLITFFTCGPKETRAWPVAKVTKAPQAAGTIHSDFERAFIRAEVISYEDFIQSNGESGAKNHGKIRLEGKEYCMRDGDVVHFRHGS